MSSKSKTSTNEQLDSFYETITPQKDTAKSFTEIDITEYFIDCIVGHEKTPQETIHPVRCTDATLTKRPMCHIQTFRNTSSQTIREQRRLILQINKSFLLQVKKRGWKNKNDEAPKHSK